MSKHHIWCCFLAKYQSYILFNVLKKTKQVTYQLIYSVFHVQYEICVIYFGNICKLVKKLKVAFVV